MFKSIVVRNSTIEDADYPSYYKDEIKKELRSNSASKP